MNYGIAVLAYIPLRREISGTSEMVSQLLFGESYLVLDETDKWIRIETCFDQYRGWISKDQHVALSASDYRQIAEQSRQIVSSRFATACIPGSNKSFMVPAGSELPNYDRKTNLVQLGDRSLLISGHEGETPGVGPEDVLNTALRLLYTPYLWGGRSSFGCDCSGFVQTVFKIHNRTLPRDARQQAGLGIQIPSLQEAKTGDLVFFTNGGPQVSHVGLLISPEEIIHCSGSVRIDKIDQKGIFNRDKATYSHTCYSVRRHFHV